MSKKLRLQLGAFVILAALVYLVLQGAHNFSSYFVTVNAYRADMSQLAHQTVRVQGTLLASSVKYDPATATLRFTIASNGKILPVVYHGPMPNEQFQDASAICKGQMGPNGVFECQKLEIQCPDHYTPASGSSTTANG